MNSERNGNPEDAFISEDSNKRGDSLVVSFVYRNNNTLCAEGR